MIAFPPIPLISLARRELAGAMREKRSFSLLAAFLGVATFWIAATWPDVTCSLAELAALSRGYLLNTTCLLFLACGIIVPAYAASAFVVERERETLDLLRLTLLRPSSLVLAKLVVAIGFFVMLVVSSLPVVGTILFLVGIAPMELFMLLAIVLLTAIGCALIGIAVSARATSIFRAVMLSYAIVLAVYIASPWLILIGLIFVSGFVCLIMGTLSFFPSFEDLMLMSSPVAAAFGIIENRTTPLQLLCMAVSQTAIAGVCFAFAVNAVVRASAPARSARFTSNIVDDPVILQARRRMYPFYLIDPLKRKKPFEDGRNPMLVKEIRWGLFGNGSLMARLTYIATGVYMFLGVGAVFEQGSYSTMFVWLLTQMAITLLAAPALLANSLTKERELGNLDMLRSTLLTPRDIVRGKLFAGLLSIVPFLVASAVVAVFSALSFSSLQWPLMATAYITLAVSCWLCFDLSLVASLWCRRTSTAVATSYFLNFLAFAGVAFAAQTAMAANVQALSESAKKACMFLSPVLAFAANSSSIQSERVAALGCFSGYWVANILFFALVCVVLTRVSVRQFARHHMHDV